MWYPHPGPQTVFCESWEDEVLFGGAAGPGKTDCLVMEAPRFVEYPDYRAIIFRKTFPELLDILDRMHGCYPDIGGEYRAGDNRWNFPSGAKVQLGHMADKDSHYQHQGKQYHFVGFDEAGQFFPNQLLYLFSRTRTTNPLIPKRMRYTSNPGGPAHQFLKDRFRIGQYPEGNRTFEERVILTLPDGTKIDETIYRKFIPGHVWDNPTLLKNDPGYVAWLYQLPEIERLRLLEGIWDSFEGQFFPELNKEIHSFDFECPRDWEFFGVMDWGYSKPWVYGVWAVDYEGTLHLQHLHYGCKEGMPDTGVKQTSAEIARTIKEIEKKFPKMGYRVAGHDIWVPKRGRDKILGPPPQEDMSREGVHFIKADNSRIQGWQQLRMRLKPDPETGNPAVYFHESCDDLWRVMPLMVENPLNPEDMAEKVKGHALEDHIPEMVRYAVMSRPIKPRHIPTGPPVGSFQYERQKYIRAKQIARSKGISLVDAYRRI